MILFRLGMIVVVPVLLIEGLFTIAVRTEWLSESGVLGSLRDPWLYGSYSGDDEYWEMRFLRKPEDMRRDNPDYDSELGWNSDSTESLSGLLAEDRPSVRRPRVLLVGDSYARAVMPETWYDFERMARMGAAADAFEFENKGVGGFGFDQICLMAKREMARGSRETDPETEAGSVLLLSLLLDDDLDRSILHFRDWPKPHFELTGEGMLEPTWLRVPRVDEYFSGLERLGPPFTPWLVRKVRRKLSCEEHREYRSAEKQRLTAALLDDVVREARRRGWRPMVVLFQHASSIEDPTKLGWRESFMTERLRVLEVPWVRVRSALLQHMALSGRAIEDYDLPPEHPSAGHHNSLGDAVAFAAILEGLRTHLGLGPGGNLYLVQDVRGASRSRSSIEEEPPQRPHWLAYSPRYAESGLDGPYVWTGVDEEGQGVLRFDGRSAPGRISAKLHWLSHAAEQARVLVLRNESEEREMVISGGGDNS